VGSRVGPETAGRPAETDDRVTLDNTETDTMTATRTSSLTTRRTGDLERELFILTTAGPADGRTYDAGADGRFVELVGELALADDGWLARFIGWLRGRDELAPAAVVAAAEMVRVRLRAGLTTSGGNRKVISDALRRADEPGALLGYWFGRYGRTMPKPIRHGLADAVQNLYDEQALAGYDTTAANVRFGDVIGFVHPRPATGRQRDVFAYAVARRRADAAIPASLPLLRARAHLYSLMPEQRREMLQAPDLAERFAAAGMTHDLLDSWLLGETDPRAFEAVLPSMSYADRLSRLGDLAGCGLPQPTVQRVSRELGDPARIVAERIRPLRLYEAARQTTSASWAAARAWTPVLERALDTSLTNVPELPGRTLILIDRSASMFTQVTRGSAVTVADRAAVFGTALALRAAESDLVQFGTSHRGIVFDRAESLPTVLGRFWQLGDGNAAEAVRGRFRGHDRVVIVTDEPGGSAWQGPHPAAALPAATPSYIWNVATTEPTPRYLGDRRYVFSGLSDTAFDAIPLIEAAHRGQWPF
jgi:hypothetical protein